MTLFSKKLKELVDASGTNPYQLAKRSGLDRTGLVRALSGDRLPSNDYLNILCSFLKLTPSEEKEIIKLHHIAKIGENTFYVRQTIKEMIEKITLSKRSDNNQGIHVEKQRPTIDTDKNLVVIKGDYHIKYWIKEIIECEVFGSKLPSIQLNTPVQFSFLNDLLFQLYINHAGNLKIQHLMRLYKVMNGKNESKHNLETLSHIVAFSFSAGDGFLPYYYYDNYDPGTDISQAMPYYILTTDYLCTFDAEFQTGILYKDQSMIEYYRSLFMNNCSKAKVFVSHKDSGLELIDEYLDLYDNFGGITHVIEPQPCLAWYFKDSFIEKYLRAEVQNRSEMVLKLKEFYRQFEPSLKKTTSIFSYEGLAYFVQTGELADLPSKFALPFSIEDRKYLLDSLKIDMLNEQYKVLMAKPDKFILPLASIQLYDRHGVAFIVQNNVNRFSTSYLEERSLCDAFYDLVDNMEETGYVCTLAETMAVIDQFINQLNGMETTMNGVIS